MRSRLATSVTTTARRVPRPVLDALVAASTDIDRRSPALGPRAEEDRGGLSDGGSVAIFIRSTPMIEQLANRFESCWSRRT
jgi:hypothetical protein